jgi:hypothetical protein
MIQLAGTSDLLRVITSAAADIESHVSWAENNAGTVTPGRTNTASIISATTTTILGSPASGVQRRAKFISLRNNHASTSCDVTVTHEDGTNTETLIKATLLAGELLIYDEEGKWHHYDANGGEYPTNGIIALRTIVEGAESLTTLVTPGRQHYHPGSSKAWARAGVTGNLIASYNMTSVTDTGAGRATFNINVDMASISYSIVATVQRVNANIAVTDWKTAMIRFATFGVGSFEIECYDYTATTAVQEDPASYHVVVYGRQF